MASVTIELPYLSSHYSIAESTLTTLTQAPTVELVNQLLEAVTKKAREYDDLKSDKLRLEVELENAVRSSESKVKVLKSSVEKGHAEVEESRKKLHESGLCYRCCAVMQLLICYRKYPIQPGIRDRLLEIFFYLQ